VRQPGADRCGAGARALRDRQHVAAVRGDDRWDAQSRAAHRIAGRRRIVSVHEIEREAPPQRA
jgi:hypothetical protein